MNTAPTPSTSSAPSPLAMLRRAPLLAAVTPQATVQALMQHHFSPDMALTPQSVAGKAAWLGRGLRLALVTEGGQWKVDGLFCEDGSHLRQLLK